MNKNYIYIALIFLWIGFVSAISFMEAWLKFKAEGVTLQIGVSIGSLVFDALNKVEIVIASILIINISYTRKFSYNRPIQYILIPIIILLIQTIYILPSLQLSAYETMHYEVVVKNTHHTLFIALEIVKVITLIIIGIKIIRHAYK